MRNTVVNLPVKSDELNPYRNRCIIMAVNIKLVIYFVFNYPG